MLRVFFISYLPSKLYQSLCFSGQRIFPVGNTIC